MLSLYRYGRFKVVRELRQIPVTNIFMAALIGYGTHHDKVLPRKAGWAGTAIMLLPQNGWFSPADGSRESEQANAVDIGKPNQIVKEPKLRRAANLSVSSS